MAGFLLNSTNYYSRKGAFLNHHFSNLLERDDHRTVRAYEVGLKNRTENMTKVIA